MWILQIRMNRSRRGEDPAVVPQELDSNQPSTATPQGCRLTGTVGFLVVLATTYYPTRPLITHRTSSQRLPEAGSDFDDLSPQRLSLLLRFSPAPSGRYP